MGMAQVKFATPDWEPTARWELRYREVLDAAAGTFADNGVLGASTQDIADRLGIRAASLYYYLPSKEAALAAICELGVKEFIENLRAILASDRSGSQKLRAAVTNHLAPLRKRPQADYIRVFLRHRHQLPDPLRHTITRFAKEYQDLIEKIFLGGKASGEFRSDLDTGLATLAFLGLCNSVISARSLPRSSSIDDFIDAYSRIVTDGVMGRRRLHRTSKNEGQ